MGGVSFSFITTEWVDHATGTVTMTDWVAAETGMLDVKISCGTHVDAVLWI